MVVNISACIRKYVTLVYKEVDLLQYTLSIKVRMTLKVHIFSSHSISRYNYYLNSLRAEDDVFTLLSMCASDNNVYKTYG